MNSTAELVQTAEEVAGGTMDIAFIDQGYAGDSAQSQAQDVGMDVVVKHSEAKRGLVLLPRRWVVERSIAWAAHFCVPARDYRRLADTLAGLHVVAFGCIMLGKAAPMLRQDA